ncbi:MAG: hypothetical protein P9L99_12015 [Candidatus Lernaella stagnicola]|nr:hypothetical protein [Candidatus Lernaella stagnicola]
MDCKARLFFAFILLCTVFVFFACDNDSGQADDDDYPAADVVQTGIEYMKSDTPDDLTAELIAGGATGWEGVEAATAADGSVFVVAQRSSQIVVFRIDPDKTVSELVVPERGWFPHLALDGSDQPHVMFFSPDATRIIVASWQGEAWQIRETASGAGYPPPAAFTVDAQGYPHIARSGIHSDDGLTVLRFDGEQWQSEEIDDVAGDVAHVAMRINDEGREQVLALAEGEPLGEYSTYRLYSLTHNGVNWVSSSTDLGIFDYGFEAALAWTPDGAAHFVGGDYIADHVTDRGGEWNSAKLEGIDSRGVSLAVDESGDLLFGGRDARTDCLVYGRYDGTWDLWSVSPEIGDVQHTAIAPGAPTIVYVTLSDLRFARKTDASWENAVIDAAVFVDGFGEAGNPNVVLSEDGTTHVVCSQQGGGGFDLAYTTDTSGWVPELLAGSEWDHMPMLAVGSDGTAYLHVWQTYRVRDGDGWHDSVQQPPMVADGVYRALAVGPDDQPVLGLYNYDTHEVITMAQDGSGWLDQSLVTLAEGFGDVYDGLRFRVDGSGSWHIAYIECSRVFHYVGAANGFVDETVRPEGLDHADSLELAVDGEGTPHLLMKTNEALYEAERRNEAWWLTEVESRNCEAPFATFSGDGALHLVYTVNRELWYATNATDTPRRFRLATLTQGKHNPQLVIDDDGRVQVYALESHGLWRFTFTP